MVAFHAQQAIEKSLKAIIDEFDLGFVKIHQIERLLEIVKEHVEANIDHKIVQMLDSLYIESRYPVDIGLLPDGKPTEEDADKFFEFAILIIKCIGTSHPSALLIPTNFSSIYIFKYFLPHFNNVVQSPSFCI